MDHVVHLLWTGGWDSTFRLCDLVLMRRVTVQPHYVIDPNRRSLAIELKTMQRIRDMIRGRDATSSDRLLPTTFTELSAIPSEPEITRQYNRLRERANLGIQYEWLPRYIVMKGLFGRCEYCSEAGSIVDQFAGKYLEVISDYPGDASPVYRVTEDVPQSDMQVLRCFILPLMRTTKLEMQRFANEHGFVDILEATWSCLVSRNPDRVCGRYTPCKLALKAGLKTRVPVSARFRAFLHNVSATILNPFLRRRL